MKIFDYEEVKMNWDSFTYPIAVGTPVSIDGVLADNASAHGLIARTVFAKPDADETLKVMTGGIIDMEEIVAGYGKELSSAAVNALCGIHFYKNGVCIPTGGSGGGVTPEIMAQIENAQWKTEGEATLFDETVTTENFDGVNIADLSYAEPITADVLKVTFNGVEYTCPKISVDNFVAYGGVGETGTDFTEFPFAITSDATEGNDIYTATAGTYTISVSTETVTTTDTFKQAVNDIAGWKTTGEVALFNESVTTVAASGNSAPLTYAEPITADTLKVIFDGVEYTCPKISMGSIIAYGGIGQAGPDFTEFPFAIQSRDGVNRVFTETAGTYSVSAFGIGTILTDKFRNAVYSASIVKIDGHTDADIAVVDIQSEMTVMVNICTISSNGASFATSRRELSAKKYVFRKSYNGNLQYNVWISGSYTLRRGSGTDWEILATTPVTVGSDSAELSHYAIFGPIPASQVTFYRTVISNLLGI